MAVTKPDKKDDPKRYRAPALEKGLDILELLASKTNPVSQSRIAAELDRSISEVFRMLSCLLDRGYIARSENGDGFSLTMRLHNLAHNWPPSKRLLEVALPEMRAVAEEMEQSCHLGVYSSGKLYVAAEAQSPLPVALTVKVATDFPLLQTASGRVLLAWQTARVRDNWIIASDPEFSPNDRLDLISRLEIIRNDGVEITQSDRVKGLKDVSCPVLDQNGDAIAAMTVPYLALLNSSFSVEEVTVRVKVAARTVSQRMGYAYD